MSLRKSKSRSKLISSLKEAAMILTFPVVFLLWTVTTYF